MRYLIDTYVAHERNYYMDVHELPFNVEMLIEGRKGFRIFNFNKYDEEGRYNHRHTQWYERETHFKNG